MPFAIFDEIDVFMDDGEERRSLLVLAPPRSAFERARQRVPDPFHAMVCAVNRKVTLQALQDEAKDKNGSRQYCVLTPQDLTGVVTDDSTVILKMPDSEKH